MQNGMKQVVARKFRAMKGKLRQGKTRQAEAR